MKIKINMMSPLLIGGQKLNSNYIESIDYIPGDVLRAAFARYILNHCKAYRGKETIDGVERINWVYFRNHNSCSNCRFKNICKNFSNIKFGFFYPHGTAPVSLTQMVCKNDESHDIVDSLTYVKAQGCAKCKGRLEYTKGFLKDNKIYKTEKAIHTRVEIDRYTKTSKDGRLYTLVPLIEKEFIGEIENIRAEDLKLFDELRIGSYASSGYGICKLEKLNDTSKDNKLLDYMKKFSTAYKNTNSVKDEKNYFALILKSDARVDFQGLDGYKTTEQYKELIKSILNIKEGYDLEKVYMETNVYRGYDTSKVGDTREEACHQISKGSVFVLSTNKKFEEVINDHKGFTIGKETLNGFGCVEIYCGGVK